MEKKEYSFNKPADDEYIIAKFNERIINAPLGSLTVDDACFILLRNILYEARKQTKLLEYICSDNQGLKVGDIKNNIK